MFIGREKELLSLERLYRSGRFEFAVIYGRRRVGKTAIMNEFIKGKDAIYFTGIETNEKQNLENFSKSILQYETGMETDSSFTSFQAALEYVFRKAQNERIILIIDEYPYVARASKSLASTLQLLIDKYHEQSKLFLILCGSSMSYMEDQVLAYKAPLYGRRTAQFKVQPFEFGEVCKCFQKFSSEDIALIYGMVGGTPQYLLQVNESLSIEENIKNIFLNPISALYEEPANLLKQEVREPAIYNAIITAIANGASKISEISTKIGEDTGVCATYIKNLLTLGIVRKEMPYGEDSTRKTIYLLEDNMFRFWYRFVPGNQAMIARGAADIAYMRIEPHLSDYMGTVFEEICKQYLWKMLIAGKTPVDFTDIGRWWGTDSKTRKQVEIDILGTADKETALFGECKWTNENVDLGILETLVSRSNLFHYSKKYFYLFAKNGFTQGCIERAKELGNVSLVTFQDIVEQ